jgi:hypothetical protein
MLRKAFGSRQWRGVSSLKKLNLPRGRLVVEGDARVLAGAATSGRLGQNRDAQPGANECERCGYERGLEARLKGNTVPMPNSLDCVPYAAIPRRENQIKGRRFA